MKSLFPKADETIILDTLYAADDNLKSATDLLLSMGYEKRDSTASAKGTPQRRVEVKVIGEKEMPAPPRKRGIEDKQKSEYYHHLCILHYHFPRRMLYLLCSTLVSSFVVLGLMTFQPQGGFVNMANFDETLRKLR